MTYARHSLIRLWHYSAVATKQERILLNQAKTKKTPQVTKDKKRKGTTALMSKGFSYCNIRTGRGGPR